MLEAFKNHIHKNLDFLKESKLLIAISGGLDSVVLTHLCNVTKLNVALAHCNFNLRGNESDTDETFVSQLAEDLDLELFVESFETEAYAEAHKISIQMAARELRYNWFHELAEQLHYDYILTAHHADDNLETFLINLTRGTGLEGLTGIPEVNDTIVRPLLKFSRVELENYAKTNKIDWRNDSSNALTKYMRNKLRHDVIPVLKDINPQLLKNFGNTVSHLQASKAIVEDAVNKTHEKVVSVENNQIIFSVEKLQKLPNTKAYLYELLKDFNFTEWEDVYNLLQAQSGKYVFSATHRLIKNRNTLILAEINSEEINEPLSIGPYKNSIETALGVLHFDEIETLFPGNSNTICVDKDLLKYPLTVRKWEKGDYFYPFGMPGKKKLSKFFKDEKLSIVDKENIWLLCSGQDIVWIMDKRADNRFKITNKTNQILKISLL